MKKKILAVLSAIVIASSAFALVSCSDEKKTAYDGEYTPATSDDFYDVVVNTMRVDAYDITSKAEIELEKLYTAYDGKVEIQFLVFADAEKCKTQFDVLCNSFGKSTLSDSADGYDYYENDDGKQIYVASRINNTAVLCYGKAEAKEEIGKLLSELGYRS